MVPSEVMMSNFVSSASAARMNVTVIPYKANTAIFSHPVQAGAMATEHQSHKHQLHLSYCVKHFLKHLFKNNLVEKIFPFYISVLQKWFIYQISPVRT